MYILSNKYFDLDDSNLNLTFVTLFLFFEYLFQSLYFTFKRIIFLMILLLNNKSQLFYVEIKRFTFFSFQVDKRKIDNFEGIYYFTSLFPYYKISKIQRFICETDIIDFHSPDTERIGIEKLK